MNHVWLIDRGRNEMRHNEARSRTPTFNGQQY